MTTTAGPPGVRPPRSLHDAARALAAFLDGLEKTGYPTSIDTEQRVRVYVTGNDRTWFEVDNPHGYWDVTCSSGADADTATSDVTVPRAAFDMLVELAEYTRGGGQTTDVGLRAIEALDAAGLLPRGKGAS